MVNHNPKREGRGQIADTHRKRPMKATNHKTFLEITRKNTFLLWFGVFTGVVSGRIFDRMLLSCKTVNAWFLSCLDGISYARIGHFIQISSLFLLLSAVLVVGYLLVFTFYAVGLDLLRFKFRKR
jgi:predicted membrane-bound mannosyltransferase